MGDLKLCTVFTGGINTVEKIKAEFENYPQGMTLDEFRDFLHRYSPMRNTDHGSNVWPTRVRSHKKMTSEEQVTARVAFPRNSPNESDNLHNTMTFARPMASSASVSPGQVINNGASNCNEASLLHRSFFSNSSTCPLSVTSPWRIKDWSDFNATETLFHKIDGDNDGFVTWDDILQVAVEEATQSITVMTEEMRSYSFSRVSPRMKLIQSIHGLEYHNSLYAVVTRANPLVLMSKKTMSVVRSFAPEDLDNTHPSIVEYLPLPDILLTYSAFDKTIRGWWSVVSSNRMGTLNPVRQEYGARRIRVRPNVFPYSFFIAGSQGVVSQFQVPKQRSVLDISHVRLYDNLHSRESGGITDFALTEESILSTGFDHRLLSTNLETGRSILIGRPLETIRLVEYNRSYACLPSVSYTNQLLLWDVRSSAVTPNSTFRDDMVKPHLTDVIGLSNTKGLPYVITADLSGLVKIWDFRMLSCVQTIYADGSSCDALGSDLSYGGQDTHNNKVSLSQSPARYGETRSIRSLCYFGGSHEIVCCSSERISCVRYNHRVGGDAADLDTVCHACHDVRQGTFILQSATRISVWDAASGYRKRIHDRTSEPTISYWQKEILSICIDQARSRLFLAIADGLVEVRSSKTLALIESFRVHDSAISEMIYSQKLKSLVAIAENGTLSVHQELDAGNSDTTLPISSQPLTNLTLSEKVGLVACCGDSNLYVLDLKLAKLVPHVIITDRPATAMLILGSYPVLVTGDEKGQLIFRSTTPVEESRPSLATLSLRKRISGSSMEDMSRNVFCERNSRSMRCPSTSQVTSFDEKTSFPIEGEGMPPVKQCAGPTENLEDNAFEEMVKVIAMDERSTNGICALACDDVTHRLFAADRSGKLYIISFCNLIQSYGLQKSVFEHRVRYRLKNVRAEAESSLFTVLLAISPSRSPVNFLAWFPGLSLLIACDSHRLVRIFDNNGSETGQLLMDRLPPKNMMDVVDDSSFSKVYGEVSKVSNMAEYNLPIHISISAPCPDCAKRKMRKLSISAHQLGDDLCLHSDLVSTVDSPRVQTAPHPTIETLPNLQGSRTGFVAVLSTESTAEDLGTIPLKTSSNQRKGFFSCPSVDTERELVTSERKVRRSALEEVQPTFSTILTPHLVDLEEKRPLRPQKERECAFWRKKDMPSTVTGTNMDTICPSLRSFTSGASRNRAGSCDAIGSTGESTNAWWKTIKEFNLKNFFKRDHRGLDFEPPVVERGTKSILDAANMPGVTSISTVTATASLSPIMCGATMKHRLNRTQKLKWAKKQSDSYAQTEKTPLTDVVRTYDKELRQCIRGKGRRDRLHKNYETVPSSLIGLQSIVPSDRTLGE